MTQFQKALTAKKCRPVVIIEGEFVVRNSEGVYNVYDSCNTFVPTADRSTPALIQSLDFDAAPFVEFYNNFKAKQVRELAEKKEAARLAEETRMNELRGLVSKCHTPSELAHAFNLTMIEIAGHWSDLYEGRSAKGLLIRCRADFEIVELAIEIHGAEGEYGESKNRAGEHHHTFGAIWGGLDGYQEACKRHFNGNKYFYRSQEDDQDSYMERIKEAEDMDAVKEIMEQYEELEAGFYDCNGNLEIADADLNSADFTGYSEDIYSHCFCYKLGHKGDWTCQVDEETED